MPIDAFLFTGIAGVRKRRRLEHLRQHLLRDIPAERHNFIIPIIELARLNRGEVEGDLFDLYRTYDDRLKKFRAEVKKFDSRAYKTIKCVFIHTHLTNFITGHFRSWVGSSEYKTLFKGLRIVRLINLIDNVYSCQFEVAREGYPYTLDQLITWRDNEQMATEILAGLLFRGESEFDTSKVVALNHCLSTIESLLFDSKKPEIYVAYPMSKIRSLQGLMDHLGDASITKILEDSAALREIEDEKEIANIARLLGRVQSEFGDVNLKSSIENLQAQNLEYRKYFGDRFIAFDPGTIDEVPLISHLSGSADNPSIKLKHTDCWPQVCEPKARLAGHDVLADAGELEIKSQQVRELIVPVISDRKSFQTSIGRQVRSRDFRLIEQSKGLVAYRPTLGGRWSGSVLREIEHVYRHLRRPFYVIKGCHDGNLDEGLALGWEYGSNCWGEFDLSTQEKRLAAFETAGRMLSKNISDMDR